MKKLLELPVTILEAAGHIIGDADYTKENSNLVIEYYCNRCGTYFKVNRKMRSYSFSRSYDYGENYITCPECKTPHTLHSTLEYSNNLIPLQTKLFAYELKDSVKIIFKFYAPEWKNNGVILSNFEEELVFKVKERETIFKDVWGNYLKLGNPLDLTFFNRSYLCKLVYNSVAKKYFKQLTNFLKIVRNTIELKHKELHGFKLKSTYTPYDVKTGRIAFPLFNIAYRLIFTDSPNLDRNSIRLVKRSKTSSYYERLYGFNRTDVYIWSKVNVNAPYKYLMSVYGLIDNPTIRKILANDIFAVKKLAGLQKLKGDNNQLVKLYILLYKQSHLLKPDTYLGFTNRYINEIVEGLNVLKKHYELSSIIKFLENRGWGYVVDTVNMLNKLPNKHYILSRKIKLKHLHDWCVNITDKLNHVDFSLEIPKKRQKSWTMKLDNLKFFMPTTSYELKKAGQKLKNCVGTYDKKCQKGVCNIVLVSNNDSLIACLEVNRSRALIQAKLSCNKIVAKDNYINEKVLEWCRKAHVKPCTYDVKLIA